MKKIVKYLCIVMILFTLCSCNKEKELEKQGYVFVESEKWYEKEGESKNEIIINLTQSNELVKKTYPINPEIDKIVFIGNPQIIYSGFSIVVNSRENNLYIEFQNFNYKANVGQIGLDASNVIGEQKVYLLIKGTSSITGGKGLNGKNGVSYNYNSAVKGQRANNGENGVNGNNGNDAVVANKLYISVNEHSKLTLMGGNAGSGGIGGNGEASKYKEISQAGHAGSGGDGGNGGNAISIKESLSIENLGECILIGGDGGNAGEIFILCDIKATKESSKGGEGGKPGQPGYSYERGYGESGKNGINGVGR